MRKFIVIFTLTLLILPSLAAGQSDFHFVPCGRSGEKGAPGTEPCEFRHLIILIVRVINYLISVAALVAMYQVLSAGFWLTVSLGNPEKIESSKKGLTHAVLGFAMIIFGFIFINLLINGLLGSPTPGAAQRPWWDLKCIYLDSTGCPQGIIGNN